MEDAVIYNHVQIIESWTNFLKQHKLSMLLKMGDIAIFEELQLIEVKDEPIMKKIICRDRAIKLTFIYKDDVLNVELEEFSRDFIMKFPNEINYIFLDGDYRNNLKHFFKVYIHEINTEFNLGFNI